VKDASRLSDGQRPVVAFIDLQEVWEITRLHDTSYRQIQTLLWPRAHT